MKRIMLLRNCEDLNIYRGGHHGDLYAPERHGSGRPCSHATRCTSRRSLHVALEDIQYIWHSKAMNDGGLGVWIPKELSPVIYESFVGVECGVVAAAKLSLTARVMGLCDGLGVSGDARGASRRTGT
jgi:hypothetical protein